MFKKNVVLIIISILFFGCTPITSVVYTDNSVCTESVINGALKIAWDDYDDLPVSLKKTFFDKKKKQLVNYFHNREFNNFYVTFTPKFKDSKERKYFYYIQKNGDECRAKLYKRELGIGNSSLHWSMGSIITLDSYKLNLCNCSDNSVEFGF